MSAAIEGGCQCGAARFRAVGEPKFVSNCHCAACRKATGAAFSTWIGFAEGDVAWKGAPSFYESSLGATRGFCASCGTPLSYAGAKWPGELHFLIGVLDEPARFVPRNEAFADEALPWARKA